MKLFFVSSMFFSASAFIVPRSPAFTSNGKDRYTTMFATDISEGSADATTVSVDESKFAAREELLELAKDLNSQYGVILIDSKAKDSFRKAVEKLESVAELSADMSSLVGDWTLVCSSSTNPATEKIKIDTNKIPFFNDGPVRDIKNTLNDSVEVLQRVKFGEISNSIDAIDHVINYSPPDQLSSFLKNIPDAIKDLDINPLKVSDTKVVLKHKAEIEGVVPVIKTKLSLQAIVVNVAGESKNLEPNGEDVLGVNIPFGELLNAGSFDTTFLDDSMRISRSKTGPVDQIRVFVRKEKQNDSDEQAVDEDDNDDLDDDELAEGSGDGVIDADIIDAEKESTSVDNDDDEDDEIIVEAPSDIEN